MTRLLDNNACVHFLRKKGNPLVKRRFVSHPPTDPTLCSVVTGELRHGAAVSGDPAGNGARVEAFVGRFAVLPFDEPASRRYAEVRAGLEARGLVIGEFDMMIAAIALAHDLTVVTHNTGEFSRVPGLMLEDWESP